MEYRIEVAGAGDREAACRRLVAMRLPADRDRAAERYRELFATGELDPGGLFVARAAHGTIRGAMLVQVMPGALGLAWPPTVERGRGRDAIEDALVSGSAAWLRSRGVKVCQAFAREEERESFASLERGGFRSLTKLLELRRNLEDIQTRPSRMQFEPIGDANRTAFVAALLASFEGSLDCPEVGGSRTEAELLASYTESSAQSTLWFLAKLDGEPAGVVLLEEPSEPGVCELTYVGIAPRFRRRGLGAELVRFALQTARNTGHHSLHLSVDERNLPARRLYETLGFQASGERCVFLANWSSVS